MKEFLEKLGDLASSRKFMVAILAIIGVVVLAAMGKIAAESALDFVKWVLGTWLVVHAGAETGKAILQAREPSLDESPITPPETP